MTQVGPCNKQTAHAMIVNWDPYQWFSSGPAQFFPEKLDDSLEAIQSRDLVHVLLHYRGITNAFEPNND